MKKRLEAIVAPLLKGLEGDTEAYRYQPMHRKILIVVGALFVTLTLVSAYFSLAYGLPAGLLSTAVFLGAAGLCLLVGLLGSDRAVAGLWGNR